jgi:predicted N-acyltransferase
MESPSFFLHRAFVLEKVLTTQINICNDLSTLDPVEWNALTGDNNPFVEHAFLALLESSGSVGEGTGWMPAHVLVRKDGRLVGAAPTYVKTDSYGEYIFDWVWADAYQRLGLPYYPKVTVAVPFTPATGPRLLVAPDADKDAIRLKLLEGIEEVRLAMKSLSVHLLFCQNEEAHFLEQQGFIRRSTHQFHWRNDQYENFDGFLCALRSSARKQVRKERRKVKDAGVDVRLLRGDELSDDEWNTLYALYRNTSSRKWGRPYLTRAFFEQAARTVGERAIVCFGLQDGEIIAGTLSFAKGNHLYGRYWGCFEDVKGLHFELCYYRLIEHAIDTGMSLVEAGAQGQHKLKRGYLPVVTHSAHRLEPEALHDAIGRYVEEESEHVREEILYDPLDGPFREESKPPWPLLAGIDFDKTS